MERYLTYQNTFLTSDIYKNLFLLPQGSIYE